jgi:hypothetical protein
LEYREQILSDRSKEEKWCTRISPSQSKISYWKAPSEVNTPAEVNSNPMTAMSGDGAVNWIDPAETRNCRERDAAG